MEGGRLMLVDTDSKSTGVTRRVRNRVNKRIEAEINFQFKPEWQLVRVFTSFFPWGDNDIDPRQIERIRLYEPTFVPVFRRKVYQTPAGGLRAFEHYGFGYHSTVRQPDPELQGTWRPVYGFFSRFPGGKRPTHVKWFEHSRDALRPGSQRAKYGLPMWFTPWGSWVEAYVEEMDRSMTKAVAKQAAVNNERKAEAEAELASAQEESAYKGREEAAWRRKHHCDYSDLGPADEREQIERQRNPGAFRGPEDQQAGQVFEPKPFVHVQSGDAA